MDMDNNSSSKFQIISQKFSSLAYGRSEGDRQRVMALLDDLNALDFTHTVVNNVDKAVLIINQCCSLVSPNDTFLVAKGCHLIKNLVDKQNVRVEGRTLSVAVQWCVHALKQCPPVASQDVLTALEVLLRGYGDKVQEHSQAVVSVLDPLLHGDNTDDIGLTSPWELRLAAIQCLEALSAPPVDGPSKDIEHLEACLKVFQHQLSLDKQPQQNEANFCKIIISALRGLENVVSQSVDIQDLVGDAVGAVKAYMLYGLPGNQGLKPTRVVSAAVPVSDVSGPSRSQRPRVVKGVGIRTRSTKKKSTLSKKKNIGDDDDESPHRAPQGGNTLPRELTWFPSCANGPWRTSDSDYSDTETGQAARLRSIHAKVRQTALQLMLTITKVTQRRILFGYWWSLLPDGPHAPNTRTLATCLLKDPSPRCRTAALAVLWALLSGSKGYLMQAEHNDRSGGSFTPFSVSLGNMLRELHRCLALALASEGSVLAITQLLRVMAALVQNTPYHRLQPGLVSKAVRSVRGLTAHKDVNVQVAALTVLGAVVAIQPSVPELKDCLLRSRYGATSLLQTSKSAKEDMDFEQDFEEQDAEDIENSEPITAEIPSKESSLFSMLSSNSGLPWILELCLTNLGMQLSSGEKKCTRTAAAPVCVESLQVIGALSTCHFSTAVIPNFDLVRRSLESSLGDTDEAVRLHGARATESVVSAMQNAIASESEPLLSFETVLEFWNGLLSGPLTVLVQSLDQTPLRAAACDCLSNIGMAVFEQLTTEQQILSFTLLFGSTSDDEGLVRASAVRGLGLYILFPCLRKNIQFVLDSADAIMRCLKDETLLVRTKASWSLGNLSDALVLNSTDECEQVPFSIFFELLQASVGASLDNDKVRSNGVRALGNLLRIISPDDMRRGGGEIIEKAVNTLIRNANTGSNMKIRWNACYAIGNMLKNGVIYENNSNCQTAIFPVLCTLVQNFRNFKVRINAALALGIPNQRSLFGPHFISVWAALLTGIDNSEHMSDFSEYKHRDTLLDQICCSLCHLACLVTSDDLVPLQNELILHQDSLEHHLRRMEDAVVPERAGILLTAANRTSQLFENSSLNPTQRAAARLLQNVFAQSQEVNNLH